MTIQTIPLDILEDCFQLVKANSIEGIVTDKCLIFMM